MITSQYLKTDISVIRVVFNFYPIKGGSITHAVELSRKINPYVNNQVIIAPDFGCECKNFDDTFEVPVMRVKYPHWVEDFNYLKLPVSPIVIYGYARSVLKHIKKMNYDDKTLLYVHGTLLGAILTALNKVLNLKIPLIILQDSGNLFKISKRTKSSAYLSFFLLKYFTPNKLIVVDDGMGVDDTKKLCTKYDIPCESTYHSIDSFFFKPTNIRKEQKFTILSNHRLDNFKRVDLTILIFKKFLEHIGYRNDVRLLIMGGGPELEKLVELVKIKELENYIEFVGEKPIKGVVDSINNSDIIIGTSLISNLNLSIQEAMACEKAVVVFDSGEIEKLIKNMKNGILVPSNNLEKFAEKLKYLYENPEVVKVLGQNARKTIIEERSWETRVKKELKIYEEILSRKNDRQ